MPLSYPPDSEDSHDAGVSTLIGGSPSWNGRSRTSAVTPSARRRSVIVSSVGLGRAALNRRETAVRWRPIAPPALPCSDAAARAADPAPAPVAARSPSPDSQRRTLDHAVVPASAAENGS